MIYYIIFAALFIGYIVLKNKMSSIVRELRSIFPDEIRYSGYSVYHNDLRNLMNKTSNSDIKMKIYQYFKINRITNILVLLSILFIFLGWIFS